MKENLKNEESKKKGQVIVVSEAALAKEKSDLTPKERCEADHVGRCGACDDDGTFTACA
ncbi:hypothetical protein [Mucilaginibacter aquariorum]|uniref:Uncharacterized protein n=1 Tax=Mucilaginibacter aquariorum TaxID=2967225 RepID=A0ABT1T6D1_9SPHI|nr:hypothetical protein [Mucilaginibacter aquariorum]MCQ6960022.1 hypothetical protein [Mucilaginibacter aquariorum]